MLESVRLYGFEIIFYLTCLTIVHMKYHKKMIRYIDEKKNSGTQTFENGDIYEGSFKDGLKHGKGTLTTRNKRSYEGDWENDKPHGFGINTFPNGKVYTGSFSKGKPIGDGQWTYSDGRTYYGTWINGEFKNKESDSEIHKYKFITFIINALVIGAMLAFVVYWLLSFLKII